MKSSPFKWLDFLIESKNGTKFSLFFVSLIVGTAAFISIVKFHDTLGPHYWDFCMFIMGMYTVYCGGNLANNWVAVTNGTNPKDSPSQSLTKSVKVEGKDESP